LHETGYRSIFRGLEKEKRPEGNGFLSGIKFAGFGGWDHPIIYCKWKYSGIQMIIKYTKIFAAMMILIGGFYFAANESIDKAIKTCGMKVVHDSNEAYLQDAFDNAAAGFLILSGVKSGLAVIEGSEVGVGFNLQLGDIVQSVYDYVDISWKTALAGGTVLLLTRLMLQTINLMDHWSLSILFFILLALLISRSFFAAYTQISDLLKEIALFLVVLTSVLYFILPFSVSGAAFLSKAITQPLILESQKGFASMKEALSMENLNQRFFPENDTEEDSILSKLNIKAKVEKIKKRLNDLGTFFKGKTEEIAILTIKLIAGYLFDCIIFPLIFFMILYFFTKGMLGYLFGIRRSYTTTKELEEILMRYRPGPRERKAG